MSKKIDKVSGNRNSPMEIAVVKQAFAISKRKRYRISRGIKNLEEKDLELDVITKIPEDASDMMVITKAKKLAAYITAITVKSPSKYRATYINRLQNLSLDAIENLLRANFVKLDTPSNIKKRAELQSEAIVSLKMVAYIALLADTADCILTRQYKQISLLVGESINLAVAWIKSDAKRLKNK